MQEDARRHAGRRREPLEPDSVRSETAHDICLCAQRYPYEYVSESVSDRKSSVDVIRQLISHEPQNAGSRGDKTAAGGQSKKNRAQQREETVACRQMTLEADGLRPSAL